MGVLTIMTFFASKTDNWEEHAEYKTKNARSHFALMIVTYLSLIFDNLLYFYDKTIYCGAEITED